LLADCDGVIHGAGAVRGASQADFDQELVDHPRVRRVVALPGGYYRAEANAERAQTPGMIASFSSGMIEGLGAKQGDDEFNATLAETIDSIYRASIT